MQKKMIVLALAAAFSTSAFAADTSVYGVVDVAVQNISASGTRTDMSVVSSGLAGSRIGVKASEDLLDGLKATVALEYSLDVAANDGILAARKEALALAGGFGTVTAGYLPTTGYDFSRFDPISGSAITPLGNITKKVFMVGNSASLKRLPRALAYTSPDMGGLTLDLNYTTDVAGGSNLGLADNATTGLTTTAYMVAANYSAGPLAAALVHANMSDTNAGGAVTTETAVGASYNLDVVQLFATYQTNKVDAKADADTVMSVSAKAPVGPGSVALSYAKSSMTAQGADKDASGVTVAWLQGLSKATTFYAAYSTMSQGTATNAYSVANNALGGKAAFANGTSSSMVVAGLNKKF